MKMIISVVLAAPFVAALIMIIVFVVAMCFDRHSKKTNRES